MTTIYRNRKRGPGLRRALVAVGFFIALLIAGFFFRPALERVVGGGLSALWRASDISSTGLGRVPEYFRGMNALLRERDSLKEQLAASKLAVLDRNLLYEENLTLKESMGRSAQPNALLAAVLVRPPESPYDTLIIDAGEDKQVKVGDRVAASGAFLIGTVEAVYATTARIKLYSAPNTSYDAFLRGSIPIRAEGIGGGSLKASVPHDAEAAAGDLVTLPGIEPNLSFVVESIEAGRGDSAAEIYMHLAANPFSLRFAEVWRSAYAE